MTLEEKLKEIEKSNAEWGGLVDIDLLIKALRVAIEQRNHWLRDCESFEIAQDYISDDDAEILAALEGDNE